jgi:hypothetical protein
MQNVKRKMQNKGSGPEGTRQFLACLRWVNFYENKPECSDLWSEMNGRFSKSNAFRHSAKKLQPVVGELYF